MSSASLDAGAKAADSRQAIAQLRGLKGTITLERGGVSRPATEEALFAKDAISTGAESSGTTSGTSNGSELPSEITFPPASGSPLYARTSSIRFLPAGISGISITADERGATEINGSISSPVTLKRKYVAPSTGEGAVHAAVTTRTV